MFVVTNSEVYHVTDVEGRDGSTLCGFDYTAETSSVVTQQPGDGFRLCANCGKKV